MSSLKLEVFTPGASDIERRQEDIARRVAEAYREGHGKGFAQGAEASAREHAEAQDQLRSQFIEALRDAQLTHTLAQREVIESIFPLLEAMTETLSPILAESGLITELDALLRRALDSRPEIRPRITCAPELEKGVRLALSHFAERFDLEPDSRLTPLEARLHWDDGFDEINFQACLDAMQESITRFREATMTKPETEELADVG